MPARHISDRQRNWLEEQLADWSRQGIISTEQAGRIRGFYESADEAGDRTRSVFSFVIFGLAAFLVGLALFLLIGYNWDAIPRATKLLLIFGMILGTHAAGLYLRFSRTAPRASEIVMFLGCLFYGAGIWLVAQVFHLEAHYPDGVWWWAIGVLPFALCLDSILLHTLLVALLALWGGLEVIGFSNLGARLFWGWWTFPNGAYTLPLLALPGLIWAYRRNSRFTVGLYVPLLAWWILLQAFAWDFEWQAVYFVGCTGALLLIVSESHRAGNSLAVPIRFWGVVLAAGALIPLSFGDFHKEMFRSGDSIFGQTLTGGLVQLAPLIVLAVATLLVVAYSLGPAATGGQSAGARLGELFRRQWLPAALAVGLAAMSLWSVVMPNSGKGADEGVAWFVPTLAANVAMIGTALWLMRLGLREDRGRPFAFGVLYFLLWSVLRYFDLFASVGGMPGAAMMFLMYGAVLFGVATFWRGRKETRHV